MHYYIVLAREYTDQRNCRCGSGIGTWQHPAICSHQSPLETWEVLRGYEKIGVARSTATRARNLGREVRVVRANVLELPDIDGGDLQAAFNGAEAAMLEAGKRADEIQARLAAGETEDKPAKRKKPRARTLTCPTCHGGGYLHGMPINREICWNCNGQRKIKFTAGNERVPSIASVECTDCSGGGAATHKTSAGRNFDGTCGTCRGTGRVPGAK